MRRPGETLDAMIARVRGEHEARMVAEEAERARVRAIIASFWDGELPPFDNGAYQVLDVDHVKACRKRNNVERPTHYGALIQELTTTALVLYATLRERDAQIRALHAYQAESDLQVAEFEAERDHYRAALTAQTERLERVRRLAYAADVVAGDASHVLPDRTDALHAAWAALQPGDLDT